MAGMMDELLGALGDAVPTKDIGSLMGGALSGADTTKVEAATRSGIGAMFGALADNASTDQGAASLLGAVQQGHRGSVMDHVGSALDSPDSAADGDKILGHAFGNNRDAIQQEVAKESGLDLGTVTKLLPMLAPIVMGMIGKKATSGGLDAGGLSGLLKGEMSGLDLGDVAGILSGGGSGGGVSDVLSDLAGAATGGSADGGSSSGIMEALTGMLKKFSSK